MKKLFNTLIADNDDIYCADDCSGVLFAIGVAIIIIFTVFFVIDCFIPSDTVYKRFNDKQTDTIIEFYKEKENKVKYDNFLTAKQSTVKKLQEPLIFKNENTCKYKKSQDPLIFKNETSSKYQKAEIKNVPATLKAIPGKPLSEAEITKTETVYTWKDSDKTITVIYPNGTTKKIDKSLLLYLIK